MKTAALSAAALSVLVAQGVLSADWRLENHSELLHRIPGDGVLPLVPADEPAARLDTQLEGSVLASGLYVRLRLAETEERTWGIQVPEAYYDASAGPLELSLGRKALPWDYAFGSAPLSWLGPAENKDDYDAEPLVLTEYFVGLQVWQAACTVRLEDSDELCLLRTEGFSAAGDWQALVGYEAGLRMGAGLNWIATDRLALRVSMAWDEHRDQRAWQPDGEGFLTTDPLVQTKDSRTQVTLGASYTHASGWDLLLEHAYNSAALSQSDWQTVQTRAARVGAQAEPQPGLRAQNLGWLARAANTQPLAEHRTLIRSTQSWQDWSADALITLWWTDQTPTWLTQWGIDYQWASQAEVGASWRYYDADGVLADLGQELRLSLTVTTTGR
ncbi:MAG: hypothetical protein WEB07_03675 [Natronospirillum sp.]